MKMARGKKIQLKITVGYGEEGEEILDEIKKRAGSNKRGAGTALADFVLDRIFKADVKASLERVVQTVKFANPQRAISYDVDENTEDPLPRSQDMSEIPVGKPR